MNFHCKSTRQTNSKMFSLSNWLHVVAVNRNNETEQAKLLTLPALIALSDIKCDHYVRLLAVDITAGPGSNFMETKLKVFRGIDVESEHDLNGLPAAIECFYVDENEPRTPILAVALNESILFYRNMKPYFKYTLPELPITIEERDIWQQLKLARTEEHRTRLIDSLNALDRSMLSKKSQSLLQLSAHKRNSFLQQHLEEPLSRYSNIMGLKCLARVSSGQNHVPSYLVLCTDYGEIFILEAQSFCILYKTQIRPEMPISLMAVHGTYEMDFCIILATRYGSIYLLRKNSNEPQEIFKLSQPPVSLVLLPIDQTIIVSTMDQRLVCYSKKGKQLYAIQLPAQSICMTTINLIHFGLTLICVALSNGLIQFYMQKYLVDQLLIPNTIANALIFGRMGWEEHVLAISTADGNLILKILKRHATFEPDRPFSDINSANKRPLEDVISSGALEKSKKCSIFVEQIAREKENAKMAYKNFQMELWRLRYTAARATIDALNASEGTISNDITQAPVQLSGEVCGIGPTFRLYITLQNLSTHKMASNLMVLLHADRRHYTIQKSLVKLPSILPGIPLKIDIEIMAVFDALDKLPPSTLTPDNSCIKVLLLKPQQSKPLIAATIAMPPSQLTRF